MTRVFGPTRAPGVRVEEQEGNKTIEPAALGWVGYAGILEKGKPGELSLCSTKTAFKKRHGAHIPESLLPDCAMDFFDLAQGAGGIAVVRITDGNEIAASITLYTRNGSVLAPMGRLDAANGGRWGGKWKRYTNTIASVGGAPNNTLVSGVTDWETDEWKGGWLELAGVANKRYPITGSTSGGIITLASDQTPGDDLTAASASYPQRYYLVLDNGNKALSVKIGDGEANPGTEFSIEIYVDGQLVNKYPDLSTDPSSAHYWVNIINNDDSNDEVFAVDLWEGAHVASVRPANVYGKIASGGVTATTLTAIIHEFTVIGAGNPTFALGTSPDINVTTDDHLPQTITLTMTSATAFTASSDKYGALGSGTFGTQFVPSMKWAPPFKVTAGATPMVSGDTIEIVYKPLPPGALVGGVLYPDKVNAKLDKYRIVANTHKTITVTPGSDITTIATAGDLFMVSAALEMSGGRDGNADIVDADYQAQAWNVSTSPYNRLAGKNIGLVKFATPGVTSTTVQKAGVEYATARNHQYRYEIPYNTTTDNGAVTYVNDTLGRSDYAVVSHPSYGYVPDPDPTAAAANKLKLIPLTGMIQGRESMIAAQWEGYHKAAAGLEATLPRLLKTSLGDRVLDEELLNSVGIGMVKKTKGNWILWGSRTLWLDSAWKWKHQREQMSYYEHVLGENMDWIVFAINDPQSDGQVATALVNYFLPEWSKKRALRGNRFENACFIKVDGEINTDIVRAAGDKIAMVALRLADTTERLVIKIGRQGIFESKA